MVSRWNNVVIRYGGTVDESTIREEFLRVRGSKSGMHAGELVLSDDSKTLVFKPYEPFAPDERVTVDVDVGLCVADGIDLPSFSFDFYVSNVDPRSEWSRSILMEAMRKEIGADQIGTPSGVPSPDALISPGCDTLPASYPIMTVTTLDNPEPGALFFSPFSGGTAFVLGHLNILDYDGTPLFYRKMPSGCFDFKVQSTGVATYYQLDRVKFYAVDSSYAVVDSFTTGNGYLPDLHELMVLPDNHALLMVYDVQTVRMDTIVPGGDSAATVVGLVIQELDAAGNVIFQWRSWDHFQITDGSVSPLVQLDSNFIDYCHGNSIEKGSDGNLIISSRHMNEITKIDIQTGEIIWRLGLNAVNNNFTFVNDTRGFSHQHDARWLPNGNLTLFDNGNFLDPEYSRGLEYEIDEENMTATLVWEYRNTPDTYGAFMGNVQRHASGGSMICWGGEVAGFTGPRFTDLHADGSKALEIDFTPFTWSYRAFRFPWKTNLLVTNTDSLSFGVVNPGDSTFRALTVRNNSPTPMTITCLSNSDSAFSCLGFVPVTLPPQGSIGLTLMFKPGQEGEFVDRLYVRSVNDTQLVARPVILSGSTFETSTGDPGDLPKSYALYQNFPNPFNPSTTIRYDLPQGGVVKLAIYDLMGREVVSLVHGIKPAGRHEVVWDAQGHASGIYFYQLSSGSYTDTKKLAVVK
jgi:hypothetical protein